MFSNYLLVSLIRKVTSAQRSLDVRASVLLPLVVCFASLVNGFIDFPDAQVTSGYLKFLIGI